MIPVWWAALLVSGAAVMVARARRRRRAERDSEQRRRAEAELTVREAKAREWAGKPTAELLRALEDPANADLAAATLVKRLSTSPAGVDDESLRRLAELTRVTRRFASGDQGPVRIDELTRRARELLSERGGDPYATMRPRAAGLIEVGVLDGHAAEIRCLDPVAANRLLSISDDGARIVWDLARRAPLVHLGFEDCLSSELVFARLPSGGVRLIQLESGEPLRELELPPGRLFASHDGQSVLVLEGTAAGARLRAFDTTSGSVLWEAGEYGWDNRAGDALLVEHSPDDAFVKVEWDYGGALRLFDARRGEHVALHDLRGRSPRQTVLLANGQLLIAGVEALEWVDATTLAPRWVAPGETQRVVADESLGLVLRANARTLELLDSKGRSRFSVEHGTIRMTPELSISPAGDWVGAVVYREWSEALGVWLSDAVVWDTEGREITRVSPACGLAFLTGSRIAAGNRRGPIFVWERPSTVGRIE